MGTIVRVDCHRTSFSRPAAFAFKVAIRCSNSRIPDMVSKSPRSRRSRFRSSRPWISDGFRNSASSMPSDEQRLSPAHPLLKVLEGAVQLSEKGLDFADFLLAAWLSPLPASVVRAGGCRRCRHQVQNMLIRRTSARGSPALRACCACLSAASTSVACRSQCLERHRSLLPDLARALLDHADRTNQSRRPDGLVAQPHVRVRASPGTRAPRRAACW